MILAFTAVPVVALFEVLHPTAVYPLATLIEGAVTVQVVPWAVPL